VRICPFVWTQSINHQSIIFYLPTWRITYNNFVNISSLHIWQATRKAAEVIKLGYRDCADRWAELVKQCYIALCILKRDNKNCTHCHINLSNVLGYSTNFFSWYISVANIQDSSFILVCILRPTYLFRCLLDRNFRARLLCSMILIFSEILTVM